MAKKKEESDYIGFSPAELMAAQAEGIRIRDNPRSMIPSYIEPEASDRDVALSALMGFRQSVQDSMKAAELGDPLLASLAALGGAAAQPGPDAIAAQRSARQADAQRARVLAELEATPMPEDHALVKKHPEFKGMTLGMIQKLAPYIQRNEEMEQKLAIFRASEESKNKRADLVAKDRKDAQAATKRLPAPSVLALSEGQNVSRLLPEVERAIASNENIFGPISGRARGANPYDEKAQTVDARMRTASQAFGRFMEGGVLRKEDEEKYRKMFPQLSDTPELAKNKLAIVRRQLAQTYAAQIANLGGSGYDVSGFEAIDIPASIFEPKVPAAAATAASVGVMMMSPSGKLGRVSADKVAAAEAKGFRRVR